jgi:hypothetical protein
MPGAEEEGWVVMASNFKISAHRNGDNLYLRLVGGFDGTSACELLNVMKQKCQGAESVFIDTSGLGKIYPFGQDTFRNNLHTLKDRPMRLRFTGKNAMQIAPEKGSFWWQEG